jgi:hypothetical protein
MKLAIRTLPVLVLIVPSLSAGLLLPQCPTASFTQYLALKECLVGNVHFANFGVNAFPPLSNTAPPLSTDDLLVTPSTSGIGPNLNFSSLDFRGPRTSPLQIQLSFAIEPNADEPPVLEGADYDLFDEFCDFDEIDFKECYGEAFQTDGTCPATLLSASISDKGRSGPPRRAHFRGDPIYETGFIITVNLGTDASGRGLQNFDVTVAVVPEPVTAAMTAPAFLLLAAAAFVCAKPGQIGLHVLPAQRRGIR